MRARLLPFVIPLIAAAAIHEGRGQDADGSWKNGPVPSIHDAIRPTEGAPGTFVVCDGHFKAKDDDIVGVRCLGKDCLVDMSYSNANRLRFGIPETAHPGVVTFTITVNGGASIDGTFLVTSGMHPDEGPYGSDVIWGADDTQVFWDGDPKASIEERRKAVEVTVSGVPCEVVLVEAKRLAFTLPAATEENLAKITPGDVTLVVKVKGAVVASEKFKLLDPKDTAMHLAHKDLQRQRWEGASQWGDMGRIYAEVAGKEDGDPLGTALITTARRVATTPTGRGLAPTILVRPAETDVKPLGLECLRISALLMATRARVLVDCTFRNPFPSRLQGTLMVSLPEGASPCYLGMFQGAGPSTALDVAALPALVTPPALDDPGTLLQARISLPSTWDVEKQRVDWGELRPARVVEATQGRAVYEQVTRPQRRDPALMEWAGGNSFTTRIFPIPANGLKRVFFVYDVPPVETNGASTLTLPVPAKLPPSCQLEVATDSCAYDGATLLVGKTETPLVAGRGFSKLTVAPDAACPDAYVLTATSHVRGTAAGFGRTESIPGNGVHARLVPEVNANLERETGDAVFVLDTSLSEKKDLAPVFGRLLRSILEHDVTIDRFRVVTFDVAAHPLFAGWRANNPEGRAQTLEEVGSLWLEGATDLDAALNLLDAQVSADEHPTFFLLSDGEVTWGADGPREFARRHARLFGERWICYQVGDDAENLPLLTELAGSNGRVVSVTPADVDAASLAHRAVPEVLESIHVEGVSASDLVVQGNPRSIFPGQVIEVAFRTAKGEDPRKATIVLETDRGKQRFALDQASPDDRVAARAWAELTASTLLALGDKDADGAALALSEAFAIANRVASFLILETDAEYRTRQIKTEDLDLDRMRDLAKTRDAERPTGGLDLSTLDPAVVSFLEKTLPAQAKGWSLPRRVVTDRSLPVFPHPAWGERVDALAAFHEADERWHACQDDEAERVLSSLVEQNPEDAKALRLCGFELMAMGRTSPRSRCSSAPGAFARSSPRLISARRSRSRPWVVRPPPRCATRSSSRVAGIPAGPPSRRAPHDACTSRLLAGAGQMACMRVTALQLGNEPFPACEFQLFWNLDDTDVDLHVNEASSGEHVFYSHMSSATGGRLLWDDTTGLGPEIYLHPTEIPSRVFLSYYGTRNVEGVVPAAGMLVAFGPSPTDPLFVRAAVLEKTKSEVVLYEAGR